MYIHSKAVQHPKTARGADTLRKSLIVSKFTAVLFCFVIAAVLFTCVSNITVLPVFTLCDLYWFVFDVSELRFKVVNKLFKLSFQTRLNLIALVISWLYIKV